MKKWEDTWSNLVVEGHGFGACFLAGHADLFHVILEKPVSFASDPLLSQLLLQALGSKPVDMNNSQNRNENYRNQRNYQRFDKNKIIFHLFSFCFANCCCESKAS